MKPSARPPTGELISAFHDPIAVAAWTRAATSRADYLAASTTRMFELAGIATGHRVLVVGAGAGQEALEIARRVGSTGEVVATDVSAAMVAEAERLVAAAKITNVRCRVMDAQQLEFSPTTFDAVVSRNALMFIPELMLGLAEIKRVLKLG